MPADFSDDVKKLSYREASQELETIVRKLDSGDLELEDTLEYYARGVRLLHELNDRLSAAHQKVQELNLDLEMHTSDDEDDDGEMISKAEIEGKHE